MSQNTGKFKKAMRPIDVWGLALGAIIGVEGVKRLKMRKKLKAEAEK